MNMGKKQRFNRGGSKLSLEAFLQLDPPAPAHTLAPRSKIVSAAQSKRDLSADLVNIASDYVTNNPTPTEMHARQSFKGLCLECQMIFATWKQPAGYFNIPRHERKNAHHSFKDIEHCWCPLCRMLLRNLLRYNDGDLQALRCPEYYTTSSDIRIYEHMRYVPCYYIELIFAFGEKQLAPSFMMFVAGRDGGFTAGTLQPSTDCRPIWDLATRWLQECRDWHEDCATTHSAKTLPTRLLHIGSNNNELRLVLSKLLPYHTPYATLSHCWGSKPFMKLTRRNFNAFLTSIQFECLSKTFRDAIVAARNLGFQYLWIDSMCVIQEDEEDWQHEASNMSHVYSNSSLNLAAADSPDGDTGLFFDDRPDFPNAWKVTFPSTGPAPLVETDCDTSDPGRKSKEYIWNCIANGTRAVIDESQLASRAWTLQERLLSPRTLYFGRDQTAWECRVCNGYEALPDLFDEGIMKLSPGNYFNLLEEVNPLDSKNNVQQWSDIVENYSKRSLTVRKDKLVAISGLARILSSVYGTDYVAGLWVKDLVRLLAWHKSISKPSTAKDLGMAYRAPSWSWASVDGKVVYPKGFVLPLEGEYAVDVDNLSQPPLAKVLEAVTEYPEDQFGEVTGGFIRLRVQTLFRVTIDTKDWLFDQYFPVQILGLGTLTQFSAYPDYDLESIEGESLLLPLVHGIRSYPSDYPEFRGLFLDYVEDGVYRRKGAWRVGGRYSNAGFEDANKIARVWHTKGADRIAHRTAAGLDEGEFASLWNGDAYVVKIV
ncbi:hypothetical protein PVAG01_03401 [Phlyctema vagabunda]|uniref:Heterokaryon incompatibility domain-containing protein n=1 Tax=Phlyctema vagabunda TaxID=108571 RepID=A0ABR4PLC0_9HELO